MSARRAQPVGISAERHMIVDNDPARLRIIARRA
jgi:hypothetical protein